MSNEKILVVGIGGIGSYLLHFLLELKNKHIAVVDFDLVEKRNCANQDMYLATDVSQAKVDVAAKFARDKFITDITVYNCKVQDLAQEVLASFHYIVCCVDNLETRRYCNYIVHQIFKSSLNRTQVLIDVGSEKYCCHVRVISPSRLTSCLECDLQLFSGPNLVLCGPRQIPYNFFDCLKQDVSCSVEEIYEKALVIASDNSIETDSLTVSRRYIENNKRTLPTVNRLAALITLQVVYGGIPASKETLINAYAIGSFVLQNIYVAKNRKCWICGP